MNPQDYDVPVQYRHWVGDPAEDRMGPFFFRIEQGVVYSVFRVQAQHCNSHATVHGGLLMAFADYTLCIAANEGKEESVPSLVTGGGYIHKLASCA